MNHLTDEQLNEYLDGTLNESARAEAQTHLGTCADCRARLAELQHLFTKLDDLPEAPLEHDLVTAVLANLPHKNTVQTNTWTRAFAAQLGVAVGFIFWLGMQAITLINVPQIEIPTLPAIEIQTLFLRLLSFHFPIPEIRFPSFNIQIPDLTINLQPSTSLLAVLALSTLTLWLVGNVILLRGRQEAES